MLIPKVPASLKLIPPRARPQLGKIEPLRAEQLRGFLSTFTLEDKRQVRELWKAHAARKTLIDFESNHADQTIRLQT